MSVDKDTMCVCTTNTIRDALTVKTPSLHRDLVVLWLCFRREKVVVLL